MGVKNMTWTYWWKNETMTLNITDFRKIRKRNRLEYGTSDPDINIKRRWGIHTNGAQKGNPLDTCLDWTLSLGHIEINIINWNYNKKLKKTVSN